MKVGIPLFLILVLTATALSGCLRDRFFGNKFAEVGDLNYDVLNPSNHPRFWLEVTWMGRAEPEITPENKHEPIDSITDILDEYSKRTDVELLKTHRLMALGLFKSNYTLEELKEIEALNRTIEITVEVFSIYVMYIDGQYAEQDPDHPTLGLALSASSMVIFKRQIDKIEPPLLDGKKNEKNRDIERAVIMHEMGHILGLPHSNDTDCVMHAYMNTTRYYEEISKDLPRDFCAESRDLIKSALMGIKKIELDRTAGNGQEKVHLWVELYPRCKLGQHENSYIKAEYWYEGDDPRGENPIRTELVEKDGRYTCKLGNYRSGDTLNYRILLRDRTKNDHTGPLFSEDTDRIMLRKSGQETPFPGGVAVFCVIAVVLIFHGERRGRVRREER